MYDVYTEVSEHMGWLQETILENGGLASCGFTMAALPSNGQFLRKYFREGLKKKHGFYPHFVDKREGIPYLVVLSLLLPKTEQKN